MKPVFVICIFEMLTYENECFAIILDRYKLNSQKTVYESEFQNEFLNVNWYMETDISIWHIWIFDPSKIRGCPSFQTATRINSKN